GAAGLGAEAPAGPPVGLLLAAQLRLHLLGLHAREEVEHLVVVADMLEAEIVILAYRPVALGCAIFARLVAAFPFAGLDLGPRGVFRVPRTDPDAIKVLGIQLHQS